MRSTRTSSGIGVRKGTLPSINRHCSGRGKERIPSSSENGRHFHAPLCRLDNRRSQLVTHPLDHSHSHKTDVKGNVDGEDEFEEIIYLGNEEDALCTRALVKLAIAEEKPHADVTCRGRRGVETRTLGLPFCAQPKDMAKNRKRFNWKRSIPLSERPRKQPLSTITESDKQSLLCTRARREPMSGGRTTNSELPRLGQISQGLCDSASTSNSHCNGYSSICESRRARTTQIEEYLKRIEKQYNIVEDKAKQVSDWLQTLES